MIKKLIPMLLAALLTSAPSWARKPPSLRLFIDDPYFSPNRDQVKDLLAFRLESEGMKKITTWEIRIEDSAGATQRTLTGTGPMPETAVWDGLNDFGAACADGSYLASLTAWDSKRGVVSAQAENAMLDLAPPIISLARDRKSLGDFLASAADLSGIEHWKLEIRDSKGDLSDIRASSGAVPSGIAWTPEENAVFPPGQGTAILFASDRAGNRGQSPPVGIAFPKTEAPPKAETEARAPEPAAARKYLQMTTLFSISDLFGPDAGMNDDLRPEAAAVLAPLAQVLSDNPGSRAVILGHVDSQARRQDAAVLSSHFAWRIYSHIVKRDGVDKKKVAVKGLGNDVPLARENTAGGRSRNRRIEIQIFIPE